jgi:hypothetical protein
LELKQCHSRMSLPQMSAPRFSKFAIRNGLFSAAPPSHVSLTLSRFGGGGHSSTPPFENTIFLPPCPKVAYDSHDAAGVNVEPLLQVSSGQTSVVGSADGNVVTPSAREVSSMSNNRPRHLLWTPERRGQQGVQPPTKSDCWGPWCSRRVSSLCHTFGERTCKLRSVFQVASYGCCELKPTEE